MTFEKQGAMPNLNRLVSTLGIAFSLALLAMVVAPAQASRFVVVSSRLDGLGRNLALIPGDPMTHLGAATATNAVLEANALPSGDEEQDRPDALDEPRVCFLTPCSFRILPDRQRIVPRLVISLYPLRC